MAGKGYDDEPSLHESLLQEAEASRPDNKCRDPFFLVLFLVNIALIAFVAFSEGISAIRNSERSTDGDVTEGHSNANLLYALIVLAAASAAFSALWLSFMIRHAKVRRWMINRAFRGTSVHNSCMLVCLFFS